MIKLIVHFVQFSSDDILGKFFSLDGINPSNMVVNW